MNNVVVSMCYFFTSSNFRCLDVAVVVAVVTVVFYLFTAFLNELFRISPLCACV